MDVAAIIIRALGGATAVALATNNPVQTVHSWKANRRIPRWHRRPLLDLAARKGVELPAEAISYLAEVASSDSARMAG